MYLQCPICGKSSKTIKKDGKELAECISCQYTWFLEPRFDIHF